MLKRSIVLSLVFALTLGLSACKKTTLDRVGSVLIEASNLYVFELDALLAQRAISQETYDRLILRARAIQIQSQTIAATIRSFPGGKVTRDNSVQVVALTGRLIGDFEQVLLDPAIVNLGQDHRAIKILRYAQATSSAIAITLAALFPKGDPSTAESNSGIKASKVKIDLPPRPKLD